MGSSLLFYTINTIQLIMYSEFLETRLQILFFYSKCVPFAVLSTLLI